MERLCESRGLEVPHDKVFDYYRKQRIYAELVSFQKKSRECCYFDKENCFQFGYAFRKEDCKRLVEELTEEGIMSETSDGRVYLTDWKRYTMDF